jgi:hypothetical protein
MIRFRLPLSLLTVAVLAGCASVEPGSALSSVQSLTKTHTGQPLADRSPNDDWPEPQARSTSCFANRWPSTPRCRSRC